MTDRRSPDDLDAWVTLTAQETARAAAALEAFAAAIRREAARRPYGGPAFAPWRASRRAYAAECEAQAARMRGAEVRR